MTNYSKRVLVLAAIPAFRTSPVRDRLRLEKARHVSRTVTKVTASPYAMVYIDSKERTVMSN
jgi:hypothetical protein